MLSHFEVGAIEIRLIAARSRDARSWIIRHQQFRSALEKVEGADVTIDPMRQPLAESRTSKGVSAGPQHGNKDRSRYDFTRDAIVDRYSVASPVHEHLLTGAMILSQNHVLTPVPALI
jgi:hypothetical protein